VDLRPRVDGPGHTPVGRLLRRDPARLRPRLAPSGTPFQLGVWRALQDIPYGTTATYRDVASAIGNPKSTRAVGMANNRNPIALLIPCHRVIGADGSLTGYGGGLEMKAWLLDHERTILARSSPTKRR
jgi:methylated-DNA-[protein]-cysteine S-methyltransferase